MVALTAGLWPRHGGPPRISFRPCPTASLGARAGSAGRRPVASGGRLFVSRRRRRHHAHPWSWWRWPPASGRVTAAHRVAASARDPPRRSEPAQAQPAVPWSPAAAVCSSAAAAATATTPGPPHGPPQRAPSRPGPTRDRVRVWIMVASQPRRRGRGAPVARAPWLDAVRAIMAWRWWAMAADGHLEVTSQGAHRRNRRCGGPAGVLGRAGARSPGRIGLLMRPCAPFHSSRLNGISAQKRTLNSKEPV